jgi:class 3 adenylate cyclase
VTAPAAPHPQPLQIWTAAWLPWAVGAVGLATALAGLALPWIVGSPPDDVAPLLTEIAGNSLWLVVGLVVWQRQPRNPVALLMVAHFFATFIWELGFIHSSFLWTMGGIFSDLPQAIFAHIVLAWPSGRLAGRLDRAFVAAIYVYAIAANLIPQLFWKPDIACQGWCPENVLLLWPNAGLYDTLGLIFGLAVPFLGLGLLYLFWRHWQMAGRPARRAMRPIAIALPFRFAFAAIGYPADALHIEAISEAVRSTLGNLTLVLFPLAFLIGAVQLRLLGGAVAGDILEAGARVTTRRLEELLRTRLGDPQLQVLRWSPAVDAYLDQDGVPVAARPADGRTFTPIERDGRPLAAVVHDTLLADDRSVMAGVTAAICLALDATELRDELRARGGDATDLPTGEVTFLFGDLEASTALVRALGPRYGEVLAEVRRVVAEEAHRGGGRMVDAHGDEVFVAFSSCDSAVSAAIAIQHRLQAHQWADGLGVRMRIGLHTGRPERTSSGYVGLEVHRAARIMAVAQGGQIVASQGVLSGRAGADARVRPLGARTLRGLEEPVELVEISPG